MSDNLIDLALPDGQCAQRYFVRRIHRYAEFCFHLIDGGERYGYVTAFDNVSVQISTSDVSPKAVLIPWAAIVDVEETGDPFESKHPNSEFQEDIKTYTRAIKNQAQWNLAGKQRPIRIPPIEAPNSV